jgi:hypothetical protein
VFLFLSLSALIREAAKKGIKIGTKRNKTKRRFTFKGKQKKCKMETLFKANQ